MSKQFIYNNFTGLNNILKALEIGAFEGMEDIVLEVLAKFTTIKNPSLDYNLTKEDNIDELGLILEEKDFFDEDSKIKIREVIAGVIKNYDTHIVNGKIPKKDYINELIRVIRDNIDISHVVTLDNESIYDEDADKLREHNARGLASWGDKQITVTDSGPITTVLHEINHMRSHFFERIPNFYNIIMQKVLSEGYATFHQMFVKSPGCNAGKARVSYGQDKSIVFKSPSEHMSGEYAFYRNIINKIILLIGMDKLDEIRYKDENFVLNIKNEIGNNFGQENADKVMKAIILASNIINGDGIKDLAGVQSTKKNYERESKELSKEMYEKIKSILDEIEMLEKKINSPELLKNDAMEERKIKLAAREKMLEELKKIGAPAHILKNAQQSVEKVAKIDEAYIRRNLEIEIDEYKERLCTLLAEYSRQIVNRDICIQNRSFNEGIEKLIRVQVEEPDKIKYFIKLESAMNECFLMMIDKAETKEELIKAYKLLKVYATDGIFLVQDNDVDITKRNFRDKVYNRLIDKMQEKGLVAELTDNRDKNKKIHEAIFFSDVYELENTTVRISGKKHEARLILEEKNSENEQLLVYVEIRQDKKVKYYRPEEIRMISAIFGDSNTWKRVEKSTKKAIFNNNTRRRRNVSVHR